MSDPKPTCSISADSRHIEPCTLLATHTEYGNPKPKKRGIFAWALVANAKPSRTFFGVVSTEAPAGFLFKFCPFCGTRIDAPFTQAQ